MSTFTESVVEDAALAWLEGLRYAIKFSPEIVPEGLLQRTDRRERSSRRTESGS